MHQVDPVVITGVGLVTSLGMDREAVWDAVRRGESGVKPVQGVAGLPDGLIPAAMVPHAKDLPSHERAIEFSRLAATQAMEDAGFHPLTIDRERFGCAISGVATDLYVLANLAKEHKRPHPRSIGWLPNKSSVDVANHFGLYGPRLCHAAACASGTVEIRAAVRAIQDGQCDVCLAGSGDAIHPLSAAGFRQMRVLASHDDPTQACRPFDAQRNGFVIGEGGAILVLERLSHALDRGAKIYAEILATKLFSEGLHVTQLDTNAPTLTYAIKSALKAADLAPGDIEYINAHGTGTEQNDLSEANGIRNALGRAADSIPVSASKSMLGHLVNAAGSTEMALTALALRDGFMPPTVNLTNPDPRCRIEHLPLVGRSGKPQIAMKLSVAFGGHIAVMILRRWNDAQSGFGYPADRTAAAA